MRVVEVVLNMPFPMLRSCPACGRTNRVQARNVSNVVRCGACKTTLPPIAEPLDVDEAAFTDIIGSARVPVFVDFWAAWCGPCRMAAPMVQNLAREMAGRALVLKVDTEAEPGLSVRYGIRSIPHFAVIKNGAVVEQHSGGAPQPEMRRWLENAGA